MTEKFKLCFIFGLLLYLLGSAVTSVIYVFRGMAQDNSSMITISAATMGTNVFIAIVGLWWDGFIEAFRRGLFSVIVCALIFAGLCGYMLFVSIGMLSLSSTDFYFTLKALGLAAITMVLMVLVIKSVTPK